MFLDVLIITRVCIRGGQEGGSESEEMWCWKQRWERDLKMLCYCSWRCQKGLWAKEWRQPLEARKDKKTDSPSGPLEGTSPTDTFVFSLRRSISDIRAAEQEDTFVLLEAIMFVLTCYCSHRKWTQCLSQGTHLLFGSGQFPEVGEELQSARSWDEQLHTQPGWKVPC